MAAGGHFYGENAAAATADWVMFIQRRFARCLGLAFFGISLVAGRVNAAEIFSRALPGGLTLIGVVGDLIAGDDKKFTTEALPVDNAVVAFDSNGGNLLAGIQIGKAIRLKGFTTVVMAGSTCASACAIAWLGGAKRFMGNTARVGFHAAYLDNLGVKLPAATGNALVGSYVSQLGLSDTAVIYVTSAGPDEIQWLTFADASRVNIEVSIFDTDGHGQTSQAMPSAPQPSQPSSSGSPVTMSGYWIQLYSRESANDATALAQTYSANFPNIGIFTSPAGFPGGMAYVVAIGPYPQDTIRDTMRSLIGAGQIPNDSFLANAAKFITRIDINVPNTAGAARVSPSNLEQRAITFYGDFQQQWSGSNTSALSYLASIYGDQINYYGSIRSKADVLAEKIKFAQRWPTRQYSARPGSVTATCNEASAQCTVAGMLDWKAFNLEKSMTSTGVAQYQFVVDFRGSNPSIVGESGTVLSRVRVKN